MGLAIVKAVVDAHGGEVSARSWMPGGTVICLRLPISQPELAAPENGQKLRDHSGENRSRPHWVPACPPADSQLGRRGLARRDYR